VVPTGGVAAGAGVVDSDSLFISSPSKSTSSSDYVIIFAYIHHGKLLSYVSSALMFMLYSPFAHIICEETVNLVIIVGMSIHAGDLEVRLSCSCYSHWLLIRTYRSHLVESEESTGGQGAISF